MNGSVHKKIYKTVLDVLSLHALTRRQLIEEAIGRLYEGIDVSGQVGEFTEIRGLIGTVVEEMKTDGVILYDSGIYSIGASGTLPLRIEKCEKEIISLLSSGAKSKQEIRSHLRRTFGTDATASDSDDRILYEYIGRVLRRLTDGRMLQLVDGRYEIRVETRANIDDLNQMSKLKSDFITRIHRKGGEFFEHYILTLLKKNEEAHGKTVTECKTTGGTLDGGIDGIMKTVDHLGFRETVLIQAKNRTDLSNETTVRGFLGAVYASGGNKGIFATMSDFHPAAKLFLGGIDNLVGINGDDIFRMACKQLFGIRKKGGKLVIDTKII